MTFIERIAARFGFVRQKPLQIELIVFHNYSAAKGAGFHGSLHPDFEHLRAWWPSQGMYRLICTAPPLRVTISNTMSAYKTPEGRVGDILRSRQKVFGDKAVWVELG